VVKDSTEKGVEVGQDAQDCSKDGREGEIVIKVEEGHRESGVEVEEEEAAAEEAAGSWCAEYDQTIILSHVHERLVATTIFGMSIETGTSYAIYCYITKYAAKTD